MRQDEDRFYSLPLRQGRDAHKNGGQIRRIVTPCRTPFYPFAPQLDHNDIYRFRNVQIRKRNSVG